MLEQQLEKLTAAITALTAAIESQSKPVVEVSAASDKPAAKKQATKAKKQAEPEPEAAEPEAAEREVQRQYSAEEVKARLSELAEKVGGAGPKSILKKHGIAKFSDMKPEQHDEVYNDAVEAIAAVTEQAA